jgi:hypothetical protein
MPLLTWIVLAAALVLAPTAFSHSVKDTERLLGGGEKYFQPLDKAAPAFELQDSEGLNWVFLRTRPGQPEDTTRRLVEAFGHKFIETEDGDQVHSIVTHVIHKQGRWRANFHGLRFEPTNLVVFISALVNEDEHDHEESGRDLWDRLRELF